MGCFRMIHGVFIVTLRPVHLGSDDRSGRSKRTIEADDRSGRPILPPHNVTIKALSNLPQALPRTSGHLPPRGKIHLICLRRLTHQPIKLLAQKLLRIVGAF